VHLRVQWTRPLGRKPKPVEGVTLCEDASGDLHACAIGGNYKRWSHRKLRRKPVDNLAVFPHFFPDTPEPESLKPITFTHFDKT
jgi:hypothetical protein